MPRLARADAVIAPPTIALLRPIERDKRIAPSPSDPNFWSTTHPG
jgi:hypothetical protein